MGIIKQILVYVIWIAICFAFAFIYVQMLLGPESGSTNSFLQLLDFIINRVVILKLVPIIGSFIALLFILIDVFYLKKKFKNKSRKIGIRFLTIVIITVSVGTVHYLLEKVLDII